MIQGKGENDRRNYFNINIHESMGPGPGSNSQPQDLQSDSHLLPDTLRTVLYGTESRHKYNKQSDDNICGKNADFLH